MGPAQAIEVIRRKVALMGNVMRLLRRPAALAGVLALLCALLAVGTAEGAKKESPLSIDFSVQPSVMVAPGDVTMTFVLHNEAQWPVQNIYLSSADGLLSEPIGQLGVGESQTLVRPHTVTQEELDAGTIAYTISHDPAIEGDDKVVYELSAPIIKGETQPGVSFTRQFSSEYAPLGGLVTVTYKIANTGNVALNALRIRDTLGDFTGRLEQLGIGESKAFISRVTLNEAAVSAPVLEYTVSPGEEFSLSLDAAEINIADSALDVSFSVGQSVFGQDTADAILILSNIGNVDYNNITVLDDVYGGVIADAVSLPSGSSPVEIAHTYPLRGDGEYRWRITGMNSAGEALDLRTDTLSLPDARADGNAVVALEVQTPTPKISRAGRVSFDFTISNTGDAMARDALLYEVNRGEIRRLAVLPTGAPTLCSASYEVGANAQFIFCLTYTDAQDHQRTVTSAPIDVSIAADGVSPDRFDDGDDTPEGRSLRFGGNSSTFVVLLVIAGAALTVMLTILAVTSVRTRRERLRRLAAEKQRIKAELGKTGAFPPVKAPSRKKKKQHNTP